MTRRAWRLAGALVAGCVLVFGALERHARQVSAREYLDEPFWYAAARQRAIREPLDVLVVGSSRVAYAVREDQLAERLAERLGRPVSVVDLGMGYTTWAEHALGIARLAEAAPAHVRGTVVLMEAPTGRVPLGSWAQWYHPYSPGLLRMVLAAGDLRVLWASAEQFDRKVTATLDWAGSGSALWRHRRRLREMAVERAASRFREAAPATPAGAAVGGSRGAAPTLGNVRLNLVLQGIGLGLTAAAGEPAPTETLVAAARAAGMVPVLLFVPEHPDRMDYGGYGDQRHVPGLGRLADVGMIAPPVHAAGRDFFDGIHVDERTAARYTDALAGLLEPSFRRSGR